MANTIGIQLEVDTKEVKDAGVQVDKFTKTIDGADDALEDLNMELDKTGKKAKQTGKGMKGAGDSAQKATGGFKLAKNSSQQLGYQLQDVAVQAQMGASWFTIIGQQGSQLAGVLGPSGALLGAAIGIGAAIGGVVSKAFFGASVDVDRFTRSLGDLQEQTKELEKIELRSLIATSDKEIKEINALIKERSRGEDGVLELQKKGLELKKQQVIAESALSKVAEYNNELIAKGAKLSLNRQVAFSKANSELVISTRKVTENQEALLTVQAQQVEAGREITDIKEKQKEAGERILELNTGTVAGLKAEKELAKQILEDEKLSLANAEKFNQFRKVDGAYLQKIGAEKAKIRAIEEKQAQAVLAVQATVEQRRINAIVAGTEKQLQAITNSNMSKIDLENTLYSQSISNLQIYREQKSLTDAEYNSAESLLYEAHLGKLNAIEVAANQKRTADNLAMFNNIATGFDIFGDLQEASQVKKKQQLDADLRNSQNFTAAQIANKEKEAKAIFKAQKNADLASIVSSTAVGVMGQLAQGNWVGAGAVGAAGVLNYAKASSNSYSSPAGVSNSSSNAPPPSQNTTNNSGGNTTNINFSGATGDSVETVIQYIKDQGILFDQDSAQAQVLRS